MKPWGPGHLALVALGCVLGAVVLEILARAGKVRYTLHDAWTGKDKVAHAFFGFAFGLAGAVITGGVWGGLTLGLAVAAGKELVDAASSGTCSFQDFAVTAIAAAAGAALGAVALV